VAGRNQSVNRVSPAAAETVVAPDLDRREEIVKTAARLFQRRGYTGTTVRDLAKEVGITSGSIFHHFGSKEEVLLVVSAEGIRRADECIAAFAEDASTPREYVEAMIRGHLTALLDDDSETISVLFHEHWALSDATREEFVVTRDAYEGKWDAALSKLGGEFADPRHRKLVRLLLMGAMNWCAQWWHESGELSPNDIADELSARFLPDDAKPLTGRKKA
jgi:AcrR family transcriptional regulator